MGMQSLAASTDIGWIKTLARHPFHRYFNRVLQISIILGFWKIFKSTGFASIAALGLRSQRKGKDFVFGVLTSVAFLLVYAVGLFSLGFYSFREVSESLIKMSASIVFTALAVSFLEELFFRGFLYQLCRREWGIRKALIFNCLFFSTVHFLKPPSDQMTSIDSFSGFRLLRLAFYQFSSTQFIPYFLLLALLAWMLCWTLELRKNLWMAIGLHAGLIFGLQLFGEVTRYSSSLPQWYFGGGDMTRGISALIPMGLEFLVLYFWLNRSRRKETS